MLLLSPFLPRRIGASVFVRADEKEFFDRGRDRNCFAQQDDTGASGTSREASKVCRHCPPILADKNSPRVGGAPQDFWIFQTCKAGIRRRADIDFWRGPPQPAQNAAVEIGVSLVSDSHDAPAAASQSTPSWCF